MSKEGALFSRRTTATAPPTFVVTAFFGGTFGCAVFIDADAVITAELIVGAVATASTTTIVATFQVGTIGGT
tara:strand:- start:369 stop:584 length:216 start_codon:yes stop_codon:yes gene_type:complete